MVSIAVASKKSRVIAVAAVVGLLALWGIHWCSAPPLRTIREATSITFNVQTLGEYQTTIDHIRLSDEDHEAVVWELVSEKGDTQILQFMLKEGENPALIHVAAGSYRVIAPQSADRFVLHKDTTYYLELWSGTSIFSKRSTSFSFGDQH